MSLIEYDWYLDKLKNSKTEMFWFVPNDIVVDKDFKFDIYFNIDNEYDRKMNHVFLNGKYYDGIVLFSKHRPVSKKEFENRFFIERKEWNIIASKPKSFDIVFISYNESNADSNYEKLKSRFVNVKRIHGVKGIHQAHIEAAKIVSTNMFWVIDADAVITDNFIFDYQVPFWDQDSVHVWRSINPINDLEYGYGGVKLLPTKNVLKAKESFIDMTTSLGKKFKLVDSISNVTKFNTSPFNTWKSAFRECVKLSSKTIIGQVDQETKKRLEIWTSIGKDKEFGDYAIKGALAGKYFGERFKNNHEELLKINDFDWLENEFIKEEKSQL